MLIFQSALLSMGIDAFVFMKYIVQRYLWNAETLDSKKNNRIQLVSQQACSTTLDEYGLRFWPPLYVQRYTVIQEIIENPIWNKSIKNVVEFGSAELSFFPFLKSNHHINKIMFVDIDMKILEINQGRVMPTNYDYLKSSERKQPLSVDLYVGNVAELDDRMLGMDAVIGIELIEHLYPDVLDKLPLTVFGFIKPKLAVFTTPNVEFNVIFPNFCSKFRHFDHKFEWTRKELKDWANKITAVYPDYTAELDGIGPGPPGKNHGSCSQVVIFYQKNLETTPSKPIGCKPYKLLKRVDHPYEPQNGVNIQKQFLLEKLRSFVSNALANGEFIVKGRLEIPLLTILPHVSEFCTSLDKLEYVASKEYHTQTNTAGEWFLISYLPETSVNEYTLDSDSSLNSMGDDYFDEEQVDNEWYVPDNSKMSTPMVQSPKSNTPYSYDSNDDEEMSLSPVLLTSVVDSTDAIHDDMEILSNCNGSAIIDNRNSCQDLVLGFNDSTDKNEDISETVEKTVNCNDKARDDNDTDTMSSNSDFFTTAIDNNDTSNDDMEISSSYNGSIIINNCNVYQDFIMGRNDSTIISEDINETDEKTLTCNTNCNDTDEADDDLNKNNSFTQNTNAFFIGNCGHDIAPHDVALKTVDNFSSGSTNKPDLVCSNRTLLAEDNYAAKQFSARDKEIQSKMK